MKNKEAIDSLCIKIRLRTGSSLCSLESLSSEYASKFPEDEIGNNNLKNYLRKNELGLDVTDDLKFLNKYFS